MKRGLSWRLSSVVGALGIEIAATLGGVALTLVRIGKHLVRGRFEGRELVRALASYGPASLPVVLGAAAFTGAIMVLQGAIYVERYGAQSLVGWYTGYTTLREVGPLLMGLMFSGRVGASHAAELAAMRLNEQLDALEVMAIDPFDLVIVPRAVAMVLGLGLLVVLGDAAAIGAGAVTARVMLGVEFGAFGRSLTAQLGVWDLMLGVEKGMAFGLVVAVVATYVGLSAPASSRGVGRAVNSQVVLAALGMFAVDALVTSLGGP